MKKLIVLTLILGMVSLANAGLEIALNGDSTVDQANAPASIGVDIIGDVTADKAVIFGLTGGLADISAAFNNVVQDDGIFIMDDEIAELLGVDQAIFVDLAIPVVPLELLPTGIQVDGIMVTEAPATGVLVSLFDGEGSFMESATIVPEPMTFALLGLGGLFLRRRK